MPKLDEKIIEIDENAVAKEFSEFCKVNNIIDLTEDKVLSNLQEDLEQTQVHRPTRP